MSRNTFSISREIPFPCLGNTFSMSRNTSSNFPNGKLITPELLEKYTNKLNWRYIAGNKTLCLLSLEDLKKHTIKFTDHVDVLELDKNENMKKFIEIVYDKKYGKAKERSANTETKDKMNEQMRWQIQTYISMTSPFAQLCSMEIKTYPQSAISESANPQTHTFLAELSRRVQV